MGSADASLGHRERKRLRMERAIIRATAELSIEGGFAFATLPRIAERAEIAPRTVSRCFPVKEDILFAAAIAQIERARIAFAVDEGDTVDRLEAWIASEIELAPDDSDEEYELMMLRVRAIEGDPELRSRFHRHLDAIRDLVATSVTRDTGMPSESVGPQLLAGAAVGLLISIRSARLAAANKADAVAELDRAYAFLRSGLRSLTAA